MFLTSEVSSIPATMIWLALLDLDIEVLEDVELAEPFVDVAQLDDWLAGPRLGRCVRHINAAVPC